MSKRNKIITIALLAISTAVLIVFYEPAFALSGDETTHKLLLDIIPRMTVGACLAFIVYALGYKILQPVSRKTPRALLWCIPCFLVIVANFPFTALISGEAVIDRPDLIWLFVIKCLSIGLMEEMFFRGLMHTVIAERLEKHPQRIFLSVLISSAVFGLWHLVNLFSGSNVGGVMLQVGYSFLIGAMLAVVLIKTENLWLCVLLHALFDVGGGIVGDLGHGPFQDMWFWIFTAVAGAICLGHIVYTIIKTKTCYAFKQEVVE